MSKLIRRLLAVVVFGWAGSANAGLVLNITSPGFESTCTGCSEAGTTFGWAFNVNSTITIDGLGIWDFDADGIGQDLSVGLWIDGGALLASAVVSSSSALQFTTIAGGWRIEDIVELDLTPGDYVIGFAAFPDSPSAYIDSFVDTIPEVTFTQNRSAPLDSEGLVRPDDFFFGNVLGPNLRFTENAEIPAPATLLLLGLGLSVLGFSRRQRIRS